MFLLVKETNIKNLVEVDAYCNGLISWLSFKKEAINDKELFCFVAPETKFNLVLLWTSDRGLPWKKLEKMGLKNQKIFYVGNFSSRELRRAKEVIGELRPFSPSIWNN